MCLQEMCPRLLCLGFTTREKEKGFSGSPCAEHC